MADKLRKAEAVSEAVAEACRHQQESTEQQISSLRDETENLRRTVHDMTDVSQAYAAVMGVHFINNRKQNAT